MKRLLIAITLVVVGSIASVAISQEIKHGKGAPPDLEERIKGTPIPKEYLELPRIPIPKEELTPEVIEKYRKLHEKGISHFDHEVTEYSQRVEIHGARLENKVPKSDARVKRDGIVKTALQEISPIIGDVSDLEFRIDKFFDRKESYQVMFSQRLGDLSLGSVGTLFMRPSGDVFSIQATLINTKQPNLDPQNWLSISAVRTTAHTVLLNELGEFPSKFESCEEQYGQAQGRRLLMSRECGYEYEETLTIRMEDSGKATPFYEIRYKSTYVAVNAILGTFHVGSTARGAFTDFSTKVCADVDTGSSRVEGCPDSAPSTTNLVFVEDSSGGRTCVQPPGTTYCSQNQWERLFDEIRYVEGWLSGVSSSDCCTGLGDVNIRGNSNDTIYDPSQNTIHITPSRMAIGSNVIFRDVITHEWGHVYIEKRTSVYDNVQLNSTFFQYAYDEMFGDIAAQMNRANRGSAPDWVMFETQSGSRTIGSQTWNNFSTSFGTSRYSNSLVLSAFFKRVFENLSGSNGTKADIVMGALMDISQRMSVMSSSQASTKSNMTGINEFDFKDAIEDFLVGEPGLIEPFYNAWEDTLFPGEIEAVPANEPENFVTSFLTCSGTSGNYTMYRADWNSVINADSYNQWALDPAVGFWVLEQSTTNTWGLLQTNDVLDYYVFAAVSAVNSRGESGLSDSRAVFSICSQGIPI